MSDQSRYRHILKNTSIFGGVQVMQILTAIVKGKIVAILLGPTGMGLNSIFNSVINMIAEFANFGLNYSAVRTLAQATETEDKNRLGHVLYVFNKWIIGCAIIGALILIIAAPIISSISFNNKNYTYSFMWLSLAVIAIIFHKSRLAILQGTRQLNKLAKASLCGSLVGVIIVIPIYLMYGISGILPAIIISAIATWSISWFISRKTNTTIQLPLRQVFQEGRGMASLGIFMMISNMMSLASTYLLNAFITITGSLADVGLYQGAASITNQSVGMIFTAMSVDLLPRLAAVCHNNNQVREIVNQQAEINILCVTAIFGAMILFAPLVIYIVLSQEFTTIIPVIRWMLLGMLLRAAAYPVGTISFSKGEKKTFLLYEAIITTSINFLGSAIGYAIYNLEGLSIGFVCSNFLYLILITQVTKRKYQFSFNRSFIQLYIKLFAIAISIFLCTIFLTSPWIYVCGSLLYIYSLYIIYQELNKRIQLQELWSNLKNKYKKK